MPWRAMNHVQEAPPALSVLALVAAGPPVTSFLSPGVPLSLSSAKPGASPLLPPRGLLPRALPPTRFWAAQYAPRIQPGGGGKRGRWQSRGGVGGGCVTDTGAAEVVSFFLQN